MTTKVIMANDLLSGEVVFLARDSKTWAKYLEQAWTSDSEQLTEQLLAIAQDSHTVIGAEAVEVEQQGTALAPTVFREHLRSQGPSVRTDLGKQVELSQAA